MPPLESVPNVSEGRDRRALERIRTAFSTRAAVLDVHTDRDHNRTVFTLAARDDIALVDATVAGVAAAVETIDIRRHVGVHPRVGAADVVPFVPLRPQDTERAAAAALEAGRRIGSDLGVPVFLYGEIGEGRRPAFFRHGGTEELARRLAAGEVTPSFGPAELHPTAGATLVGVRAPLVAFNLELATEDLAVARSIAEAVRASSGGMPGVQAIGLRLGGEEGAFAQVSLNVIDVDAAPLHEVVARVEVEAAVRGTSVVRGELVGLLPARVVQRAAGATGSPEGRPDGRAFRAAARALRLAELPQSAVIEIALARETGLRRA